jgi:hypothetical protein
MMSGQKKARIARKILKIANARAIEAMVMTPISIFRVFEDASNNKGESEAMATSCV